MRWVGIDEAGYGPNLGPLVMAAVTAESTGGEAAPDLWADRDGIDRAGRHPDRLWVDDSKKIYAAGQGLDRLEAAAIAGLHASGREIPDRLDLAGFLHLLGAGSSHEAELEPWLIDAPPPVPRPESADRVGRALAARPFEGPGWRIASISAVVYGPARFNAELAMAPGGSKSAAHFSAFAKLLKRSWTDAADGLPTSVTGDKHGGRHFYLGPLSAEFPGLWIDRGPEGPDLSRYTLRDGRRSLTLSLRPRADAGDGLVALASIVAKLVRERWMEVFNDFWAARVPGLRPTAGYPVDARRFRSEIEPEAARLGLDPVLWWRAK